jgi:FkbM family methyltransferase
MMLSAKAALKTLRASQPLNCVATATLHALLAAADRQSEFVIRHLPRSGTVRTRLPNGRTLRLWSRGDDGIANQVYWRGWRGHEPETASLFFRLAAVARTTLDIGAHVGFYTLLAAHANPRGQVYAFEPMPCVHQRLRRNIALNRLANVECLPVAVGESDGTAAFFYVAACAQRGIPSSSSLSLDFMRTLGELESFPTPVITMDRFVRERGLGPIDLVKIDTEATEPQVLRGMINTLRRNHPLLVCEVLAGHGAEEALEAILRPLGYHSYLLTSEGPVPQDAIRGHPEWRNYLFSRLGPDRIGHLSDRAA